MLEAASFATMGDNARMLLAKDEKIYATGQGNVALKFPDFSG